MHILCPINFNLFVICLSEIDDSSRLNGLNYILLYICHDLSTIDDVIVLEDMIGRIT